VLTCRAFLLARAGLNCFQQIVRSLLVHADHHFRAMLVEGLPDWCCCNVGTGSERNPELLILGLSYTRHTKRKKEQPHSRFHGDTTIWS